MATVYPPYDDGNVLDSASDGEVDNVNQRLHDLVSRIEVMEQEGEEARRGASKRATPIMFLTFVLLAANISFLVYLSGEKPEPNISLMKRDLAQELNISAFSIKELATALNIEPKGGTPCRNGTDGEKGDTGSGRNGTDGAQGPRGEKGDTGTSGRNGTDGAQGPPGDALFSGPGQQGNPAAHCHALHTTASDLPSGVYWVKPSSSDLAFQVYCDMTEGWTLVWSNLRGGRGKPCTELPWHPAINTPPRYWGTPNGDLEDFIVYTGLVHWEELAPDRQLKYSWSADYGREIDQAYGCTFGFTGSTYIIGLLDCDHLVGSVVPGLFQHHNNQPFSTYDADHDNNPGECSEGYSQAPWWYNSCWSGSINGGGEDEGGIGHYNGAFWIGSGAVWGAPNGIGAGNGWIWVK